MMYRTRKDENRVRRNYVTGKPGESKGRPAVSPATHRVHIFGRSNFSAIFSSSKHYEARGSRPTSRTSTLYR